MDDPGPLTEAINDHDPAMERKRAHARIYSHLRDIAAGIVRREPRWPSGRPFDLSVTRVVHDAWLKLRRTPRFDSRGHFFASARRAMSQVLIEDARRRRAAPKFVSLQPGTVTPDVGHSPVDLAADIEAGSTRHRVEQLLAMLEVGDPRWAAVARRKLFDGLAEEDIAKELGVSVRTVERDWRFARVWLAREMSSDHN